MYVSNQTSQNLQRPDLLNYTMAVDNKKKVEQSEKCPLDGVVK